MEVFGVNGQEKLYLPQSLVDVYKNQIALRDSVSERHSDLAQFSERLSNLENEEISAELLVDLYYSDQTAVVLEEFNFSMAAEGLEPIQNRQYRSPNLLDFVPINFEIGDSSIKSIQISEYFYYAVL